MAAYPVPLDEAVPNAADVLLEQHSAKLCQLVGAVLEHTQDRLAVGNVERDDPGFSVAGAFEPLGGEDEFGSASRRLAPRWRTALSATGIPASHITDDRTHVRVFAEVSASLQPRTEQGRAAS